MKEDEDGTKEVCGLLEMFVLLEIVVRLFKGSWFVELVELS